MRTFLVLILLAIISSCGKSNSSAGIPVKKPKVLPVNGSNIVGLYMAKFETVNSNVAGVLPGSVTLQRHNDAFTAYVRLFGGGPNVWHKQNIYIGGRCPTLSDDQNGDQIIDIMEANEVIGKVLIPLDANLNSQAAGKNIFPVSDSSGSYFYEREASFSLMFNDLKAEDQNPNDNLTKLLATDGLDFSGLVVLIQGMPEGSPLPPTVVADELNRSVYQSLPIACGKLEKVTSIPGDNGPDPMPGPTEEEETDTDTPEDDAVNEERDRWYDRVIDWWRRTWNREREDRPQGWGNGGGDVVTFME